MGEYVGRLLSLTEHAVLGEMSISGSHVIGRSSECDLPVRDPQASRRHTRIFTAEGDTIFVEDLGSRNGTFLNGRRISTTTELRDGDQICVGESRFKIVLGADDSSLFDSDVAVTHYKRPARHILQGLHADEDARRNSRTADEEARKKPSDFRMLYELTRAIQEQSSFQGAIDAALNVMFTFFDADFGYLWLYDSEGELSLRTAQASRGGQPPTSKLSRTLIRYVSEERCAIVAPNVLKDRRFQDAQSIVMGPSRSILAVPVFASDEVSGILALSSREAVMPEVLEEDVELLCVCASILGPALKNRSLKQELVSTNRTLRIQKSYLETVLETSPIGTALLSKEREPLFWNSAFDKFLLTRPGSASWEHLFAHTTDPDVISKCIETPRSQIRIQTTIHPVKHYEFMAVPVDNDGGNVITVRDVTREELEANTERSWQQSHKMEAVGRLAGSIAHDFNNLLAVIVPLSADIAEQANDSETSEDALAIHEAGRHAAELTQRLLQFTRTGRAASGIVELTSTLEGLTVILERLVGKQIELLLSYPDTPIHVDCDATGFEQVVLNLVGNAADACEPGATISVILKTADLKEGDPRLGHLAPQSMAVLDVTDTGGGIPNDLLGRLFEPYFTTKPVGNGLGLATVYNTARQAGGNVIVTSDVGVGTTFSVVIPQAAEPEATAAPSRGDEKPALTSFRRLLLVDDNQSVLQTTARLLRREGFEVTACIDPAKALELLVGNGSRFDAIVSDIRMPGLSGPEMIRQATQAVGSAPPCIFVSGHVDDITAEQYHISENHLLIKPFCVQELLARLEEWVAH